MVDGDVGLWRRKKLNVENLLLGNELKKVVNEIDKKIEKILEMNIFWLICIVLLCYIGFIYCMFKLICNLFEIFLILSYGLK